MTMGEEGQRESLNYKLLGTTEDLGGWGGTPYVRHLAGGSATSTTSGSAPPTVGVPPAARALPLDPREDAALLHGPQHRVGSDRFADGAAASPRRAAPARRRDELRPRRDVPSCRSRRTSPSPTKYCSSRQAPPQARQGARGAPPRALRLGDMALVEEILTSCEDELAQKQMAYAPPPPPFGLRPSRRRPSARRRAPRFPPAPSPTPTPPRQVLAAARGCAPRRRRTWRA